MSVRTILFMLYLRYVSGNREHFIFFDGQSDERFNVGLEYAAVSILLDSGNSCFLWPSPGLFTVHS